jgi:hypothetical protein
MNKLQHILSDRKAREDLKDKFEVVMAVVVLTGFVYKKYKNKNDGYVDISSLPKENS